MDKNKSIYENLQYSRFEGVGKYNIPQIKGTNRTDIKELVGFNYAKTIKDTAGKGIHFFLDDYQFLRVWRTPDTYIPILKKFDFVLSPDFSLYMDFPVAMQIYNHYRKHWLATYWESQGIEVIPTICWSGKESFDWCFDGEPIGGTVAVSAIGTQNNDRAKELFLQGYEEMIKRLSPETIIFYGNVPKECRGNILKIEAFQQKFKKCKVDTA